MSSIAPSTFFMANTDTETRSANTKRMRNKSTGGATLFDTQGNLSPYHTHHMAIE
ncbi:predicted protein [Botrytis cinerea T4]|uniref:Uncharacterized protein n=1 Tax=Botryotinia fuckeliana (strain T4) TaxID=999810 RepID=G2XXK3_BOTF4|nr:predicted protein [Botrytis cinerea T4]